ncbi:PREDICTED: ragulator complex protein LAMTOR4-like [Priapulus caudatus]|uniref:Late endosomal/lysosomal adaptor and MAPK and MTOR activator 4 n=1 Tax=Priapulus caudatus TaxID=37621 RepID=A0ABM1EDC0_PRICU|nr:PREDICTED: ragulator complex protein LAMTOR4-like [Priapulus caudatus]
MAQIIEKIPDILGTLVINEDGAVISSTGELQNEEHAAKSVMSMLQASSRGQLTSDGSQQFKRMSVVFDTFMYVVTLSNKRVYVAKRGYNPQEPVLA